MPAPLTAGFYGKLPSTGDFVARNLPAAFTARWDRWLARHLGGLSPGAPPLFFRHAGFSGVVLPSRDSAGRRFPLTIAVPGNPPAAALEPLARLGADALAGALPPDALARRLAERALPDGPPAPAPLLLWTPGRAPCPADPADPAAVLSDLLAAPETRPWRS
jgi:type VI secretion system protein ImpM